MSPQDKLEYKELAKVDKSRYILEMELFRLASASAYVEDDNAAAVSVMLRPRVPKIYTNV